MALITLSEYRTYDDLPSPAESDDQITAMLTLASTRIEKITGRTFEVITASPLETVELLNGRKTPRIYTKHMPILSVSKLEYWDGDVWQEYDVVTSPYTFKPNSNVIYFTKLQLHHFFCGYQNIRVTYTYGYTALPDDLKLACFMLTKWYLHETDHIGIGTQQDGEQSFTYTHTIPGEVMAILDQYKVLSF